MNEEFSLHYLVTQEERKNTSSLEEVIQIITQAFNNKATTKLVVAIHSITE